MHLVNRCKRLTMWNKLALWGSMASIIGILVTIVLSSIPQNANAGGDTLNVNSYHQNGGITAGQANIGQQPRQLDDAIREQIRSNLPRDKKVNILAIPGADNIQLAHKIRHFLMADGYQISGIETF